MLYSDHENVIDCFYFKRKAEAKKAQKELNAELLETAKKLNILTS